MEQLEVSMVPPNVQEPPSIGPEILDPTDFDPRESRVESRDWVNFDISQETQVLILSDSLFRSIDPHFMPDVLTELCAFSGLHSHKLVEILYQKVYMHLCGTKTVKCHCHLCWH